nr:SDR family oxidoreductase [Actinacidiphila acididurans]
MTATEHTTRPARIALITGANRGLGRSTALHLAEQGIDPVITYRSHPEEAEAVVEQARALGRTAYALKLDTGRIEDFAAFAEEFRAVLKEGWDRETFDALVNNAGHGHHAAFLEVTPEDFDEVFDVHIRGVYFLTQALVPLLADGGRIVNISTGLARFTFEGSSAYAAAKGAVEVFTRYLAKELGPRGITANTVAPGPVATDFSGGVIKNTPELRAQLDAVTALGRVGVADDIGGAIAAILADGSGWINGQRIEASGGILL